MPKATTADILARLAKGECANFRNNSCQGSTPCTVIAGEPCTYFSTYVKPLLEYPEYSDKYGREAKITVALNPKAKVQRKQASIPALSNAAVPNPAAKSSAAKSSAAKRADAPPKPAPVVAPKPPRAVAAPVAPPPPVIPAKTVAPPPAVSSAPQLLLELTPTEPVKRTAGRRR